MRLATKALIILAGVSVGCSADINIAHTDLEALSGIAVSTGHSSGADQATLDYSHVAWGGGVNFGTRNFSMIIGVQSTTASVEVHGTSEPLRSGEIVTRPFEFIFQWHPLGLATIDPYIGIGTAIVFPYDTELELADGSGRTATLHFEATLALAGDLRARFAVSKHFGLLVDAKYFHGKFLGAIPIQDIPGGALPDASFDFLIASGGLAYRF